MPDFTPVFSLGRSFGASDRREPGGVTGAEPASQAAPIINGGAYPSKPPCLVECSLADSDRREPGGVTGAQPPSNDIVYDVVGPVCESSDVFAKGISLPACRRGDFIAIRSAGAYGESMASRYNCHELPGSYFDDK